MRNIATGIFYSKLLYGMEVWDSAPLYLVKPLNTLLMKVARTITGPKSYKWSNQKNLEELDWLSVEQQIT